MGAREIRAEVKSLRQELRGRGRGILILPAPHHSVGQFSPVLRVDTFGTSALFRNW